jgi:glycosyltransferase involved in cell wall biosynthesis
MLVGEKCPTDVPVERGKMSEPGPDGLCLVMIVRNEAPVIRRCLASVLPIIDYWVIVDTGSTDGTQQIVAECLQSVPGELFERPWVDFAHNRTEAIGFARGHGRYALVVDADELVEISDDFNKESLAADAYLVVANHTGISYLRQQILRNDLPWRYEGVLHEEPVCEQSRRVEVAAGICMIAGHAGARARDPVNFRRDALLLETALLNEPDNTRYVFYLAQAYRDAGDFELATRYYRRRGEMGGSKDEIWVSLYMIARMHEHTRAPRAALVEAYLKAFQFDPLRAESLFRIGAHFRQSGEHHVARLFLAQALQISAPPVTALLVERDVYQYQLALEYAAACGGAGAHAEAIAACNRMLRERALPVGETARARDIRRASEAARHRPPVLQASPVRLMVCIPFRDPGPDFDDCVESLLQQSVASFEIVFIDDGSRRDCGDRLPAARPGNRLIRHETPIGVTACLDRVIAEQCGPDDVVIVLSGTRGFAGPYGAQQIQASFADSECQLLYGQHRLASGRPGDAMPAASEDELLSGGAALAGRSPIAFRARLWQAGQSRATDDPAAADALDRSITDGLVRAAGFAGTRFLDEVVTVAADEAPPIPPADAAKASASPADPGAALKVSCLMVTRDRLALAKRAIRCFAAQTWPNRELVVLSDGEPRVRGGLERYAAALGLANVRFIHEPRPDMTLGALRNLAMAEASGDVVCQWDDDDCYHPDRIRAQLAHMLEAGGRACFLTDQLHYREDDNSVRWIDWTLGGTSVRDHLIPGTLMMFRDDRFRYPETGPEARRGEDSVLLNALCDAVAVSAAKNLGHLYLYTYHGRNTFGQAHHSHMAAFGRSSSDIQGSLRTIRAAMAHYPVAKPYALMGRDGLGFVLDD